MWLKEVESDLTYTEIIEASRKTSGRTVKAERYRCCRP
jgi:hypothetical protein